MRRGHLAFAVVASSVLLIGSIGRAASPSLKSATVKITSQTGDQSTVYHGSGLAFQYQGAGYVVTSDHVVLHDNANKSHILSNDGGPLGPCDFVIADFGHGLALLKAKPGVNFSSWPQFSAIKASTATLHQNAAMMGYPALASSLIRDVTGTVSALLKPETVLVQVPNMVEVQNGHAEFGMSGGVVADLNDGFIGILSDQQYTDTNGMPVNTILAVPASTVLSWLSGYFLNPGHPPVTMVQSTYQLIDHTDLQFSSGSFAFSYLDSYGDGNKEFDLYYLSTPVGDVFTDRNGDLARYAADMQKRSTPCVIFLTTFRQRGLIGSGFSVQGADPVQVLRDLNDPSLEPEPVLWCNDSDNMADSIQAQADTLGNLVTRDTKPDVDRLLHDVQSVVDWVHDSKPQSGTTPSYTAVKPSDVQKLIDDPVYRTSWSNLDHRGQGTELLKQINALIAILRELTI